MSASDDTSGAWEGACACGRLRFRMTSDPIFVNCCHCRDCQRQTGSAFALNAMVEAARVEAARVEPVGESWSDRDRVGEADGERSWRCHACGVMLYAEHPKFGAALRFVRVGTLGSAERLRPDAHFFVRSRHPWVTIPEGVPAFETLPEESVGLDLGRDGEARLAAAMHPRPTDAPDRPS